jgi:hypothetical protein
MYNSIFIHCTLLKDANGFPMQCRVWTPDPVTAEVASAAVALAALTPSEAWAKGGQWGPLEGKASSHSAAVLKRAKV